MPSPMNLIDSGSILKNLKDLEPLDLKPAEPEPYVPKYFWLEYLAYRTPGRPPVELSNKPSNDNSGENTNQIMNEKIHEPMTNYDDLDGYGTLVKSTLSDDVYYSAGSMNPKPTETQKHSKLGG